MSSHNHQSPIGPDFGPGYYDADALLRDLLERLSRKYVAQYVETNPDFQEAWPRKRGSLGPYFPVDHGQLPPLPQHPVGPPEQNDPSSE